MPSPLLHVGRRPFSLTLAWHLSELRTPGSLFGRYWNHQPIPAYAAPGQELPLFTVAGPMLRPSRDGFVVDQAFFQITHVCVSDPRVTLNLTINSELRYSVHGPWFLPGEPTSGWLQSDPWLRAAPLELAPGDALCADLDASTRTDYEAPLDIYMRLQFGRPVSP